MATTIIIKHNILTLFILTPFVGCLDGNAETTTTFLVMFGDEGLDVRTGTLSNTYNDGKSTNDDAVGIAPSGKSADLQYVSTQRPSVALTSKHGSEYSVIRPEETLHNPNATMTRNTRLMETMLAISIHKCCDVMIPQTILPSLFLKTYSISKKLSVLLQWL